MFVKNQSMAKNKKRSIKTIFVAQTEDIVVSDFNHALT